MSFKSIFNNWVVKNLFWGIALVFGIVVVLSILLAIFTQHNREISVPDMSNCTYEEALVIADKAGVKVALADSVYVRNVKRGVVFSQNPKAGSLVKKGRRVFLTINAKNAKKVSMPSLVGFSTRQARAELLSKGLVLGRIIYQPDIATNVVLEQRYKGTEIDPGTQIDAGSAITLVAGIFEEEGFTLVPDLGGVSYSRAIDLIQESSLNVGKVIFDKSIKNYADSIGAVVVAQRPEPSEERVVMGSSVSIKLKAPEK